jgi:flavin-dependent dehydrogenase
MHTTKVSVAIIGASLSGATAALHLARRGISVALIDKAYFPRRKVCGEGLSIQGMEELGRVGLGEQLASMAHAPFYGFRFFERAKRSEIQLQPHVHGIGVRRYDLDALVLEACSHQGTQVYLGEEPRVSRSGASTFVVTTNAHEVHAPYLILATGASSSLPNALGVPNSIRSQSRCGLSIPLKHSAPHPQTTVDIFLDSNIQGCLTPIDSHATTLSIFCSNAAAQRLTPGRRPELLSEVCDRLGISAEPSDTALTVSGIGRVARPSHHNSIFIVGDALRQLDPIGGMGMTQALVTGRLTAETLSQLIHAPAATRGQILREHDKKLQRAVRKLVGYTSLTYWSLSTPLGRKTLGTQKVGGLAREVLMSMHRPSTPRTPYGLLSSLLIQSAGLW